MRNEFEKFRSAVENGKHIVTLSGTTSVSAKAYVLARLRAETGKRFAVVCESNGELETWAADLDFWSKEFGADASSVASIPSFETDPYSGVSPHAETQERRALSLWEMVRDGADIALISARSLVQRTPLPSEVAALGCELVRDEDFAPEQLVERLIAGGYVREDPIFGPGQFSLRGGIVDVWSPDAEGPVRIEFFGDTVDSIRVFDPETQLSVEQLKRISVAPMREFAAAEQDFKDWAFFAAERFGDDRFRRNLKDRSDFAAAGETFSGWEFHLPLSKPLAGNVFNYLDGHIFVIDEPVTVEQTLTSLYESLQRNYSAVTEAGDIGLSPDALFLKPDDLRGLLEKSSMIEIRSLGRPAAATDEEFQLTEGASQDEEPLGTLPTGRVSASPLFLFPTAAKSSEVELLTRSTRNFHGDIQAFTREFDPNAIIVMQTPGMAERLAEMLRDYDVFLPLESLKIGSLSGGFEIPSEKLTVFSERDIFGEAISASGETTRKPASAKSRKSKLGAFISDFRDLKAGDFVVHVDHGISRFDGLQTISSQGMEREFMLLIYADDAKLFVPVERMDLVSRYSSGEATSPTLDRLGGIGWQKTKAKAKRAMRDMADELLKLYAERKLVRGHAFPPDAPWQHEFEDAFPYDLTTDQATAIEEVKEDMETPVPMDRLIIGDVGYGKTEVAMRAAFKAVMDGKQAAILTPTTVLAYQHYETFKKRFSAFPVKVDLLSRFRSTKEQKTVAEAAGKGEVDVLIGTHRLLSNDVKLPKLGLVVVDEEQRFGVGHKEKLKQLKKKVDVLTLSATPIPRTLNMSLLGMNTRGRIACPSKRRSCNFRKE